MELRYSGITGKKSSNTFEFLYSLIIPILMLFPALIAGSIMIDTGLRGIPEQDLRYADGSAGLSLKQVFTAKISAAIMTAVVQVVLWTSY